MGGGVSSALSSHATEATTAVVSSRRARRIVRRVTLNRMHHRAMPTDSTLTPDELAFLAGARTAVLATIDDGGLPRLVPICFVVAESPDLVLYTPLDDKPKRVADPHTLARVHDIVQRPDVALLIDRWAEDWSRLGWLRLNGLADLLEPGDDADAGERAAALGALRRKYPQYASHRLEERPLIRVVVERGRSWGNLGS
jgi:PPOX class probable F420-dependent enzyme